MLAALGALGAVVVAVVVILASGLTGSTDAANTPSKPQGSATVQRRDLIATDTESGTLSYANPQTVFNRMSGTITWLPPIGRVIKPGQALYKVDGSPVILFSGTLPAYRDLSESDTDGPDIEQLKRNLNTLGFDSGQPLTINQTFDAATAAAVERWQASVGETQTGSITLGQIVFLPGDQRVTAVDASLGSNGGSSRPPGPPARRTRAPRRVTRRVREPDDHERVTGLDELRCVRVGGRMQAGREGRGPGGRGRGVLPLRFVRVGARQGIEAQ